MLRKIISWFKNLRKSDPLYSCKVYKHHGCAHVDGFLCDMKSCPILRVYLIRELEQQLDVPIKDRMERLKWED